MISVSEAKQLLATNLTALTPVTLPLEHASGHILAADVYAACDIPAFRQSSMDGYAVKFNGGATNILVVGEMAAGTKTSLSIQAGQATRIFTGAPLPQGADTVVMQEKITRNGDMITIVDEHLIQGANVREQGAEIKKGALGMKSGSLLSPAAIGFLAGIGETTVNVYPMPKVTIILTGSELQKPGKVLEFGQVYEANSYQLTAALNREGIQDTQVVEADDDLGMLTTALEKAISGSDIVLLTGGVSVGDYDFVVRAAENCRVTQIFHKVKQKPGKPLYFGKKGIKVVFGLPGNPSSVLNCYYNYVLPALKKLSGKPDTVQEVTGKLNSGYTKSAGLTHFLKGWYENGSATPLSAQESFRLSSFAQANCLICLPQDEQEFKAGDKVTILVLPI